MQINKQLRLAIFVIATASMMVVTLLSFGMYYHFSSQDLEANTKNSLNRSASIVEEKINDIDILTEKVQFFSKSSYDLMTDLRKYANNEEAYTPENLFYSSEEIEGIFRTVIYRMDYINFMAIILPNGEIISYSNTQKDFSYGYDPLASDWYRETLEAKGNLNISVAEKDQAIINAGADPTLFFSRTIYDFYSKELLGTLVVNCEPEFFDFISQNFPDKVIGFQLKETKNNTVLYTAASDELIADTSQLETTINLNRQPILLAVTIDNSEYAELFTTLLRNLCIILALLVIAIYLTSTRFSNLFTTPIVSLSSLMRKKQTTNYHFRANEYENRSDEIGILYQEYRNMLETLDAFLIDKLNSEQSLLKSELNVYKNQIDSHFLYNTLESINSLAEIEEIEEISVMTLSLSNMFRYASNGFINEATVAEELQNVEDFLHIQEIRYQHAIDFRCDITREQILAATVPKIILQPLVENAIYHGLNRGGIDGKIRVSAAIVEDDLYLCVSDYGIGLSEQKLYKLRSELHQASTLVREKTAHIGLINIEARIKNFSGSYYGITIFSQKEKGTTVVIHLPFKEAGN
ncbi:histidine kinase [uncultured Trichococcus sp.]|uniref:sensor histidine kinase n=1 Tax=uncultured Trichococcus sp. TaxID=189665 RepID=UPI0029C8053A|nr:histidine kinase [uncultured Trichococcus sp.]